ncbi:MAG: acetylglutamate kinase [Eubacteriales bacterium]|nr:acetylglutamate kinase [Eubacteriales bacterium]MDD3882314.1 acetylglutamate kinase [Eubacteriales bacterium]MDD4512060.1 acetylglutamate kinase [Eubacteriales bacterium]
MSQLRECGEEYKSYLNKANILMEALPYIQRLHGKTVVIKYGGNAMIDASLTTSILQDIALLKAVGVNPVVVHGGGPEINKMLKAMDIKSEFHNGLRVTDKATMEVVQMALVGKLNKDIVSQLNCLGAKAVGLSGKDGLLLETIKKPSADGVDLGYVGQIIHVNTSLINTLSQDEYIPVIAPVGIGADGESYNINADTVAGEIAVALQAEKLMFLTDIDGVYLDKNDKSTLLPAITVDEINRYIDDGIIDGGMIPKVQGCVRAVLHGVRRTHIVNGTIPHPIVLEIFTDRGIGTMVSE